MKQTLLLANRAVKEISRRRLFAPLCLVLPCAVMILFRLLAHYFKAFSSLSLPSLLAGTTVLAYALLAVYFAALTAKDRTSLYHLSLRLCPVQPRSLFFAYTCAGFWLGVVQSFICYCAARFLSVFAHVALPFSSFVALCFAQIPALLFFVSLGVLLGCVGTGRFATAAGGLLALFSFAFCGSFFSLASFGGFGRLCAWLVPSFTARVSLAQFAESSLSVDLRLPLLCNCAYALGMTVLAFAVLRKRYKFQGEL